MQNCTQKNIQGLTGNVTLFPIENVDDNEEFLAVVFLENKFMQKHEFACLIVIIYSQVGDYENPCKYEIKFSIMRFMGMAVLAIFVVVYFELFLKKENRKMRFPI